MATNPRRLRLKGKTTLRLLNRNQLGTVRGGTDDVDQNVTRAFTGCEYCGNTNAPNACQESFQASCDCGTENLFECDCLPEDPRCTNHC